MDPGDWNNNTNTLKEYVLAIERVIRAEFNIRVLLEGYSVALTVVFKVPSSHVVTYGISLDLFGNE